MAQLTQERIAAILHLAGQIDLQITEMSEEVESLTMRLESLRAMSTQIFSIQDGTLSDEEVNALATPGTEEDEIDGVPSAESILDEIITDELTHAPE